MQDREFVPPSQALQPGFRDIVTESLGYWERRRIVYNAVLTGIVLVAAVRNPPPVNLMSMTVLLTLAVLANLCYCAAYVPDLALQYSGFRATWLRWRPALFFLGSALASLLAATLVMPDLMGL